MSSIATRRGPDHWALDVALLLLGMLVQLMVLRFLRFDDLNPWYNAWTYLLGVPSVMITISMLTRVLASDAIEKSIQLGFLMSVAIHLLMVLFALNVVLFRNYGPKTIQKASLVATPKKASSAPQYFEPSSAKSESRPEYLKPVKTDESNAQSKLDPNQRPNESAKLEINVAKDEIEPKLADKPFDKPRKEAAPTQPTIASTAERLDRPDLSKPIDRSQSIEIPKITADAQSMPSQQLQAAMADARRADTESRDNNLLNAAVDAKLKIESRAHLGSNRSMTNRDSATNEIQTHRELERALTRTASNLPERPSPLHRSPQEVTDIDKPLLSSVPVPKLGAQSTQPTRDIPAERDTTMRSQSKDSKSGSRQSLGMAELSKQSQLEPSVRSRVGSASSIKKSQYRENAIPSESTFFADPRFAMNDTRGGKRPTRDIGNAASAPFANQTVPTEGVEQSNQPSQSGSIAEFSEALSSKAEIGKSDTDKIRPKESTTAASARDSSLSPTFGSPPLDPGRDRWAAPLLDSPRKGLDPKKQEIILPDIRDIELTNDRFKRPETGGPKIANSAVPIPAPAFSQRLKRNRDMDEDTPADLGSLGPQTEAAIERGLQFLAKYQRPDGSWHLEDFGERVDIRSETAATALSLLSFQGAGYTHKQFKYEKVCGNALKWMIVNQRPNGDLYVRTDAKSDSNSWLYSHAIATLALCESYGMTQDQSIKDNAQRAINFLVQSQDPQAGGWRYQPRIGSDTSVTGWCMMALKSAELSGLTVSKESYEGISKWLKASQASETQKYLYRYNWQAADTAATRHGRVPTPVMTSVGLLMRLYLGWRRENPDMIRGTDWLLERLPSEGTVANPQRDTYYWYYATQVLFHMGGDRWKNWYGSLYPLLIQSQLRDGDFEGSWEPNGRIPDAWGRFGGRLYVTTLNLLSLEVYYRHLPIYDATAD